MVIYILYKKIIRKCVPNRVKLCLSYANVDASEELKLFLRKTYKLDNCLIHHKKNKLSKISTTDAKKLGYKIVE